ncbi:MAG: Ig-like domain-containing protein, partial [Treponemataceae bacterium]|nr:Ig-like domain-containing protein [Treponemataceae bacterium]
MNTMRQPSQNPHKKIYWWGVLGISLIGVMVPLSCELFNVGLGNKVDLYPPEVRITSPVNNAYVKYTDNKIVVSGTVTDDGAISSVDLIWESGAKSKRAVVSGNSWSVTFTQGELADGRYVFTARAIDASNKSGEWQSTVNVDTMPPSGAFIFAADRGTSQDNPYNGKEKIQGMAEDGSGRLSSVVVTLGGVRIFPTDANPTPDASEMASWSVDLDFDEVVTGLNDSNSKWNGAVFTKVTGTDSLYKANLCLVVTDQAGNSAEVTKDCYVDLTYDAPRITWPASLDVSDAAEYPRDPNQYSGNIFKNGHTFEITVEDDDAVDRNSAKLGLESGTGTKYEYTANSGLVPNPAGTTKATSVRFRFTVPQEAQLPQGEYKFSFEVSDDAAYKNGKNSRTTSVAEKSFVIDHGPPTLTLNPLASNVLRSDAFTLSGTASDGWDIDSVQISLDGGVSWQDANLSGSAGSYTWTWNGTSTPEGYYNVQVISVDRGGSKSSRDLQVTIDNTAPDLSFNQVYPIVESSDKRVNGIIRASVTAADTNGLAGVRYWTYTTTPPAESIQD